MQVRPNAQPRSRSYQFSMLTDRRADDVLAEFAGRSLPGIGVAERGSNYLILRPQQRRRYGGDVAAGLAIAITLVVLMLTAIRPWLIVLLPLAAAPVVPLLVEHRPDLAISAVPDDETGATRVTVHGMASSELAAALDAYLGSLPRHVPVLDRPSVSSAAG